MQNLKVDIIYHQSPSDFEMEFNLGSCCPMRTLSDRTTDKKSFIKALVRDVARSRVIICCGPLFGSDGLVSVVARAIGSTTVVCDNTTYGINSEEKIDIIKDSIPLVTPDGYFGGCIIESGPQTIILLTENKTFRKAIMKNLIHPYMVEINYVVPGASVNSITNPAENTDYTAAVSESEAYIVEKDDNYDSVDEQQELEQLTEDKEEDNISFVMENDEPLQSDEPVQEAEDNNTYIDLYTASGTDYDDEEELTPYTPSESDQLFIGKVDQDEHEKQIDPKDNMRTVNIIIVAMVLLLALSILALVYLLVFRPMSMGVESADYIKEIFGLASSKLV